MVLMHGIMQSKESMNTMVAYLKEVIPDLYINNCEVGNGYNDSLFLDIYSSVRDLTSCIVNDPNLRDGFIAVGLSQGGYLLRSYIENRTPDMPAVLRFITMSSPLAGYYCGVTQVCGELPVFPHFINSLIDDLEYTDFIQNLVAGAGYWRNPYQLQQYLAYGPHLAHMDNQIDFKQSRLSNFIQPDKFILFGSENDGIIVPWQSAWFGFYENGDDKKVLPMEERDVYLNDLFGLKQLNEQGRIFRIRSGIGHHQYAGDEEFIKGQLAPWIVMD
ncbi:Palmitoyl-protein_thioesterase [Hexamita inflata]|uniref:Palmitoyl-protein thioesterase 1 n=1 Tax=Hexamita inflata TaxID=28002 RepID=A0ABP1GU28_9EUKA